MITTCGRGSWRSGISATAKEVPDDVSCDPRVLPEAARHWWTTFQNMYIEDFREFVASEIATLPDPIGYTDYFGGESPVQINGDPTVEQ